MGVLSNVIDIFYCKCLIIENDYLHFFIPQEILPPYFQTIGLFMTIGAAQSSHLGRMCSKYERSKRWNKSMTTMRTHIRYCLVIV